MMIIAGVILLITLIVTYLFFKRWIAFCRMALKEISEVLGSAPVLDIWNVSSVVQGRINDLPLTVKFTNQTRSSPPSVTVSIPVETAVAMAVRRWNFLDRWCSAFGLAVPMVTGEPNIDDRFYIDTGQRERVRLWLADTNFCEALLGLFETDVTRVTCHKGALSFVRKLPPRKAVAPALVFDALPDLWRLAEKMKSTSALQTKPHRSAQQKIMQWGLAPGLFMMIGIVLIILGIELYEPLYPVFWEVLRWAFPWSISAVVVYVSFVWLFVRSRTDRHRVVLLVVAFALLGSLLGAMGWRYFGNGWLDTAAAKPYAATVWETLNKGRGGRKIVFMVNGKPSAEFSRPRGTFTRGMPVRMAVYPGYYEIPWVDAWQVIEMRR